MLEHFQRRSSLIFAPEQVRLFPIKESHTEYAQKIADRMTAMGMRVTVDNRDENIGPKIKAARLERIPYILIIGDNEVSSNTVTVRSRKEGELPAMPVDELIAKLDEEIKTKAK